MIRMIWAIGMVASTLSSTAVAKHHNAHIDLKLETISAIHVPTGCVSAVEYDDGTFVQAFITDPLCLPYGVTKRFIPASERDFFAADPQQAAVTSQ